MADGEVIIRTKLDTDDLEKNAKSAKKTVEDLASGMENAGKQSEVMDSGLAKISKSLTSLEKIAKSSFIMKIARVAMKALSSINDETSAVVEKLRGASTLYGDVAVNQEQLLQNLYSISAATGESVENLGQAVYEAMSSGVEATSDMGDVLNVVTSSAKLASGGFTDTATALSATLTVVNAYKLGLEDLDSVQSMLLQTQNLGVTTVGELGDALANVTPTAASFGVKFADIATAVSLMTKQGTKTRVATTALAQVISELGKNGTTAAENLAEAAKDAGLAETSFTGLIDKGYSLGEILELISQYATKSGKSMVDMFSSVEAGRATLQLVGDNAEEFNSILGEMETASGLVQTSFEKTVDPMDQLSESWKNLQSKIGTKLLPAQQGLASAATAIINSFIGQDDAAYSLAETTSWLREQTDGAKKSQDAYAEALDAVTGSMTLQQKIQYIAYVRSVADNYDKLAKSIKETQTTQTTYSGYVEGFDKRLAEIAEKYSMTQDEILEKAMLANGELGQMNKLFKGWAGVDKSLVNNYILNYDTYKAKVDEATSSILANRATIADFMDIVVDAINAGVVSLGTLRAYNEDFANEVEKAMQEAAESVEKTSETAQEAAKNTGKALTQEEKDWQSVEAELDKAIEKYNDLKDEKDALGEAMIDGKDVLEDLNKLYIEAVENYGKNSLAAKNLKAEIKNLEKQYNSAASQAKHFWESLVDETLSDAAQSLMQGLGSAIEELTYQLLMKDEQLKEIDEQIAKMASNEEDAIESITTAEKELEDAKARGNAKDIQAAEEQLSQKKKELEALKAEKKALEENRKQTQSGEKAWKSAGKVALESLASVLESIGAELAAQAVVKAMSYRWVEAGLATAGSVAAFVAAGAAKAAAAKFEQGGVVPGSSRHGDQILARVNSGELILNAAQQENLARIIEASAVLAQSAGQSAGIHVHFDGVSFYGLDEASVGKAIYENIQNLKYEGVI